MLLKLIAVVELIGRYPNFHVSNNWLACVLHTPSINTSVFYIHHTHMPSGGEPNNISQ